jgi:hypothetical protein
LEELRGCNGRFHQQVNVVRHDHVSVEFIVAEDAPGILNGIDDDMGDLLPYKPGGPRTRLIQAAVHPDKCPAGRRGVGRREAVTWKAAIQVPREEQRLVGRLPVRQTAAAERHKCKCRTRAGILRQYGRMSARGTPPRKAAWPV